MPPSAQTNKLSSTLRLLIPRLRLLQKKDTASSVNQRRELANLLEHGREASARIRVENVISTDIAVEVMEMLELYCELLLARAGVLDSIAFTEKGIRARNKAKLEAKESSASGLAAARATKNGNTAGGGGRGGFFGLWAGRPSMPASAEERDSEAGKARDQNHDPGEGDEDEEEYIDAGLDEAAAAVFYACPRFPRDVRELATLRILLMERWGKEFAGLAQENKAKVKVPERLLKSLRVRPPPKDLIDSYLREIAKAYGVAWPHEEHDPDTVDGDVPEQPPEYSPPGEDDSAGRDGNGDGDDGQGGDLPSTPTKQTGQSPEYFRRASDTSELNKATPPREVGVGRSPVSVAPPGPRTDNLNPKVKIPGASSETSTSNRQNNAGARRQGAATSDGVPGVDELAKRFAALKR